MSSTLPILQNFQSSFAAREYWNSTSSTSNGLKIAAAEQVDRLGYVFDEFGKFRSVVRRHRLACLPTI